MRTMKNLALAAMAATALALAGCGGGGGGSTSLGPNTATTPMVLALPTDGNMYLDDSDTTLADGTFTVAAGETETRGAYAFTCGGDADCTVTIADGQVSETGGVTVAYTAAAQSTISTMMAAMDETNTNKALGLSTALMDSMDETDTDVTAKFDRTSPGVTVSRAMGASAVAKKTGFAMGDAPMSVDGWTGATLTKKTESVVVYTNIDEPTRKKFSTVWPSTNTNVNADGVVTIDLTADDQSGALLDKTDFPQPKSAGGGTTTAIYGGPSTATNYKQEASFRGMFQGGSGMYECTTATATTGCTVTVADAGTSGEKYNLGTGWTFTPDTTATAVVSDSDHLSFGWWIDAPKVAASGDYMFTVRTFASGSDAFPGSSVAALQGNVKYSGAAAGLYAVKNVEGGEVASAMHGAFTADASLTASFGDGSALGSLSGMINNFQGGMDMSDWSVELKSTDLTATDGAPLGAAATGSTNRTVAGKIGDTKSTGGGWNAMFYGPEANSAAPSGIAGTFQADFTNANIAGAFGAERQ